MYSLADRTKKHASTYRMDTTLSNLTFAFLFSLPAFSVIAAFAAATFTGSVFLVDFFAFFPFLALANRLDLARVNLALWICSAVGEESLATSAR